MTLINKSDLEKKLRMGVKHFFLWYSRKFSDCLSKQPPYPIDNLALDLNGLFHPVAQKVYQYGNNAPPTRFLTKPARPKSLVHLFRAITDKIEYCRQVCRPRKRLILCVDGVAGLGKMNQQRQRRFRTAKSMETNGQTFNSNAFTPGTKLMDHLTKYIDWYLRMMITYHPEWKGLEIVFSNEKVPGEGEHKIMQYIKKHGSTTESYCIYGLDADLVMLGMVLPADRIVIAREADENIVQFVDVCSFRKGVLDIMRWPSGSTADPTSTFHKKDAIHDFILLCFLVGNDFLPTIPSLTIIDGGINLMMTLYRDIGCKNGHLTKVGHDQSIELRMKALAEFLQVLGDKEKELTETKYRSVPKFVPDPLVVHNMNEEKELNMEAYKKAYYHKNLLGVDVNDAVSSYLDGMHWVLNYYVRAIPDWMWHYPHLYAPFLSDFNAVINQDYKCPKFEARSNVPPFLQLMAVLPSSSSDLVPEGLSSLMTSHDSPLAPYYPTDFEVDMSGKKQDWEGIVLLPPIPIQTFTECYKKHVRTIPPNILKRNINGKSFTYQYDALIDKPFLSFYGNIDKCNVRITPIQF